MHGIRAAMVTTLREKFADLGFTYSVGGQISFDVRRGPGHVLYSPVGAHTAPAAGFPYGLGQDVLPALSGAVRDGPLFWRQDVSRRQRPRNLCQRAHGGPHGDKLEGHHCAGHDGHSVGVRSALRVVLMRFLNLSLLSLRRQPRKPSGIALRLAQLRLRQPLAAQ